MGFPRASRSRHAVAVLLTLMSASSALASQGPGGGLGTASPLTQSMMAIVVYGGLALILAGGLARLIWRRF
jgi:hypothetical protein